MREEFSTKSELLFIKSHMESLYKALNFQVQNLHLIKEANNIVVNRELEDIKKSDITLYENHKQLESIYYSLSIFTQTIKDIYNKNHNIILGILSESESDEDIQMVIEILDLNNVEITRLKKQIYEQKKIIKLEKEAEIQKKLESNPLYKYIDNVHFFATEDGDVYFC